jgi:hypothetical protein
VPHPRCGIHGRSTPEDLFAARQTTHCPPLRSTPLVKEHQQPNKQEEYSGTYAALPNSSGKVGCGHKKHARKKEQVLRPNHLAPHPILASLWPPRRQRNSDWTVQAALACIRTLSRGPPYLVAAGRFKYFSYKSFCRLSVEVSCPLMNR